MNIVDFLFKTIPLLIQFYNEKYLNDDFVSTLQELNNDQNLPRINSYDFIIVGGGTAGCVVAGRLSEKYNVLLLEAGGDPPPVSVVPYFIAEVAFNPINNYIWKSVPQINAGLDRGGIIAPASGKMVGGSGSSNGNVHNRGSPHDYDNWAQLLNDQSFSYENVLKYFKKLETFVGRKYGEEGDEYYGKDGPILVDTDEITMLPLWFEAGRELGYNIGDPNAIQREGFTTSNKAIRSGKKSSSYIEYIKPYLETRENLTVIKYANVSEILLDEDKRAYGVAFTRHGIPQISYATKEVILSAGTFGSPLLLMKSGIGPADVLEEAEIPVKVPLEAVGKNLAEHILIPLTPFLVNDSSLFDRIDPDKTEEIVGQYHEGIGPLAALPVGPQCFAVSSTAQPGWPNIRISIKPHVMIGDQPQILTYGVTLGRPKSRGFLSLNSTKYKAGIRDNVELAVIDYKLLTHPDDTNDLVEAIKLALKISENTTAFQRIGMTYGGQPHPACLAHEFRSDDYWKCYIERVSSADIHMVGTCSLGPDEGDFTTSVLDSKFRVRGTTGLRVVDGSVLPTTPNSNTNAPIIMLAEKAVDDILIHWGENAQNN